MRGSICGRVLSPRLIVLNAILVRLVTTGSTVGIPSSYGLAALVWRERLFFRLVPASTDGAMLRTDWAGAFFAVRALRTGIGYAGQMIYGVWSTMDVALMGLWLRVGGRYVVDTINI